MMSWDCDATNCHGDAQEGWHQEKNGFYMGIHHRKIQTFSMPAM